MRSTILKLAALGASLACATGIEAQTVAIVGGRVHTVSGPSGIATVVIRDGRILSMGSGIAIPDGARRIDATGKWVTPGLINAATQLGLVEVGAEQSTRDVNARGRDGI